MTTKYRIGDEFLVPHRIVGVQDAEGQDHPLYYTEIVDGDWRAPGRHRHIYTTEELDHSRLIERPLAVGDRVVDMGTRKTLKPREGVILAIHGGEAWVRWEYGFSTTRLIDLERAERKSP